MNQSDKQELNDFLNSFPRAKIIETLSSIDNKIGSLHTISSKDFLYFNKLLKQYYGSVKEISLANNTLSVFINKDLPNIKEEIKEKNSSQINLLNDTDKNLQKIIYYLNSVYASFDLIVVPSKNFKQNLITLKYILANLKLHLNYIELNNADKLQDSIVIIENVMEDMYELYDDINQQTELVSQQIVHLKNNPCISENLETSQLKEELKKILNSFKRITFDEYLPEKIVSTLNNHTQRSFSYLGDVITNIQFHDIIRQKMEHIQTSQNQLINELNTINSESNDIDTQLGMIVKIPKITDIQVAQLIYTNKDYQTSIEKITNQLIEVGHEMKAMDELYNTIHENAYKFEDTFINQVVFVQEIFENYYESLINNWILTNNEVENLKGTYTQLKLNFNTLFQNEKKLRNEVRNFEQLIKKNGQSLGRELMKRLSYLFSDLQINSNSLKTQLNNITQNFDFLSQTITSFKPNIKNHYIDNSAITELSTKSDEIKSKTKEFAELSTNIANEITQSIKKIEYYNYFKETVEEIVGMLNNINNIVNYDSLKSILGDNNVFLEKIEKLYTMKSERDIHAKFTDSEQTASDFSTDEDSSYNIDDGDLELF